MKKLGVTVAVVFWAVLALFISPASAVEITRWAEFNDGVAYEIKSNLISNEHWIEMRNPRTGEFFSVSLGKGREIYLGDIAFYYERQRISLFYYLGYPFRSRFIVAEVKGGKLEVFEVHENRDNFSIQSYRIFQEKLYLSIVESNKRGEYVGGEIQAHEIPCKKYWTPVQYRGYHDVIWGKEMEGWDETFQTGVIVGIAPATGPNWNYWLNQPRRIMRVYNAGSGKVFKRILLPANTQPEEIVLTFPGDGTYDLTMKQSTWKARRWKGSE
jgi:hypothetical protein